MRRPPPNPIRVARLRQKWTQQTLADALGVTKGAVCQWELGRTMPSPRLAMRLQGLLPGLSLSAIYREAWPAA